MDVTTYTDDELNTLRDTVIIEQERRANLADIPARVAILAAQFIVAGGEQTELEIAVAPPVDAPAEPAPTPPTETTAQPA